MFESVNFKNLSVGFIVIGTTMQITGSAVRQLYSESSNDKYDKASIQLKENGLNVMGAGLICSALMLFRMKV